MMTSNSMAILQCFKMFVYIGPASPGTCFPSTSQQTYVIAIVHPDLLRWQDGVHSGPGLASQVPLTWNSISI